LQSTLTRLTKAETHLIKASDLANDARSKLQALQQGAAATKDFVQPFMSDFNPTPLPLSLSVPLPLTAPLEPPEM
jgi:hypothetical protein